MAMCSCGMSKVMKKHSEIKDEVEKFNRIAEDWWNPHSASGVGPLHIMNPTRIGYIKKQIISQLGIEPKNNDPKPLLGLRGLDVGCGGGMVAEALHKLGMQMTGIDLAKDSICIAQAHAKQDPETKDIVYRQISVEEMSQNSEEKFDVVLSLEVVEHVQNYPMFVKMCAALVRKRGMLVLSTFNRTYMAWLKGIIATEYIFGAVPVGTHSYDMFVTPKELIAAMSAGGVKLTSQTGIVLEIDSIFKKPWYKFEAIEDDLSVNYILTGIKD